MRVGAIVRADFMIRFRRVSTAVIFVLMSAIAYLWVPDPRTGRALIQVDNMRAVYNSAAIGMATAMLGTLFVGLIGFYVVSNAIRRDVLSRCGFVAASTTMRAGEYVFGKFLGNIVFLSTFLAGFGAVSMMMVVIRGEGALQPWIFIKQYLIMATPAIIFVSALAILFESVPFLSGKFGDVVYFVVWAMSMSVVVSVTEKGGNPLGPVSFFDFSGFGFLWDYMHHVTHTGALSIGSSTFDPHKPVYVFQGLTLNAAWALRRIAAGLMPLTLVAVAAVFFHRFDPVRVRNTVRHNGANLLVRMNRRFKPLTRIVSRLIPVGRRPSFARSTFADAMVSISGSPAILIAAIVVAFAKSLPLAFAVGAIAIADIASRDWRSGTMPLVYSSPRLKPMFVLWKFITSAAVMAFIVAIPIARSSTSPAIAITGALFVAAAATALGIISNTPKTFTVLFLTFWYVVMNDKGMTPSLDFANFFSKATPAIAAIYAAIAVAMLASAQIVHHKRLV
jgi:hypothetical protein